MESGLETLLNPVNKEAKPIIVNSEDLEQQAKQQLDPASYDFVAGGAGSELTLRANLEAFQKIAIVPRVLTGIRKVDTSTNLLGQRLSMPIYVTPMANHGVVHSSAEVGTAQGAKKAGTLFVTPTGSNKTMEEVAEAAKNSPRWFQLYYNKDPEINKQLLRRAEKSGHSAIVLTVDLPILDNRESQGKNESPIRQRNPKGNRRFQSIGARCRSGRGRTTSVVGTGTLWSRRRCSGLGTLENGARKRDEACRRSKTR